MATTVHTGLCHSYARAGPDMYLTRALDVPLYANRGGLGGYTASGAGHELRGVGGAASGSSSIRGSTVTNCVHLLIGNLLVRTASGFAPRKRPLALG